MADKTTKAHQRYALADGTQVPGVTTILNILDKPALIHWAWELGMQQQDYRKVRDKAANIGTIAHQLIECDIKQIPFDPSAYAPQDVDRAENAYLAWLEWTRHYHLATVHSELQLVSEEYRYGGTLDWVARKGDRVWLIDFKSSKGIYEEMKYQLAAYQALWNENYPNDQIAQCHLIRLGKDDGNFEHHRYLDLSREFEIFKHCLAIYQLRRNAKKRN